MTPLQVVEYDPAWAVTFAHLREELWSVVRDVAEGIEHVGSTSVPGLAAKPILDVDIILRADATLPRVIERLTAAGYVHRGNLGVPGREAFRAPASRARLTPLHLYACEHNCDAVRNHLTLRDHLRRHPDDVAAYSALKTRLARECGDDIDRYTAGKTAFIVSVLRRCGFDETTLRAIEAVNR